jgi:hypothetical protein
MLTMTTRVKLRDAAADGRFTDIFWKTLHPNLGGSALNERAAVSVNAGERLMEQDALSEMLEEMSLSTLLYYVLVGEGKIADEPA